MIRTAQELQEQVDRLDAPHAYRVYGRELLRATRVTHYHHSVVPGNLQTREYAEATMRTLGTPEAKMHGIIDHRIDLGDTARALPNQQRIYILGHSMLTTRIGEPGSGIMRRQDERIMDGEATDTIRIVRPDAVPHAAMDGSFILLEDGAENKLVYMHTIAGDMIIDHPDTTEHVEQAAAQLLDPNVSFTPDESLAHMARVAAWV